MARATVGAPNSTWASRIYDIIKADIVSLALPPGTVIREETLAMQLGVSRTPVREALRRLGQEGLVQSLPNRGTIVAEITVKDIRDVFQVRLALEPLAARLAAENIPADELERISAALLPVESPQSGVDQGARDLHRTIARYCGNERLAAILDSLTLDTTRILGLMRNQQTTVTGRKHHRLIIEALRARDGAAAERTMREHILTFQHSLISSLFK